MYHLPFTNNSDDGDSSRYESHLKLAVMRCIYVMMCEQDLLFFSRFRFKAPRPLSCPCLTRSKKWLCVQNIPRTIQWNRSIRTVYSLIRASSFYPKPIPVQTRTYRLAYHTTSLLTFPLLAFFHCLCISSVASSVVVRVVLCSALSFRDLGISFVCLFSRLRPERLTAGSGWSRVGCQIWVRMTDPMDDVERHYNCTLFLLYSGLY